MEKETRKGIKQIEVPPGRKAPKRLPLPDLIYTRVVKTRAGRRVVGVDTEVFFGEKDAEDTHDGGRNHRPCMDSFRADQFQSIMEKYLIILGH